MKKVLPTILIVLVFLAGIAVFLYPTVSNYLYEKNSSKAITEHSENVNKLSPAIIAEEKEEIAQKPKRKTTKPKQVSDDSDDFDL